MYTWFSNTVKPEIFTCSLFREFHNLKFVKITGREYSIFNKLYCIITISRISKKNAKIKGKRKFRVLQYYNANCQIHVISFEYGESFQNVDFIFTVIANYC